MKYVKIFIVTVIGVIGLTSCEIDVTDEITIDNSDPKLVIEGGLQRNTTSPLPSQRIRLSTTKNFLDNNDEITFVDDASVSVSDGSNEWIFEYTNDGLYVNSEIEPQINVAYTLSINWNNETYQGSDFLNKVALFDDFYFEFEEETLFTDEGYFVKFDTTDPSGTENFYYNRVARNGEFIVVPDPGNSEVLLASDEFFDGQTRFAVNPNDEVVFEVGDVATAQQWGVSEPYFDFLKEVFIQNASGGLDLQGNPPPASIRGNIINITNSSNRPLGFFYTVDIEEDSITITE